MRKTLTIIGIILIIASCSPADKKESIKEEIKQYKIEVSQLNIKITELEKEMKLPAASSGVS